YGVYEDLTATTTNNFCSTLRSVTSYSDTSKIHTTDHDTSDITNQAYVLVSGGPKDLDGDGADGFFDGLNEGNGVQFDDPMRIEYHGDPAASRYDDLMRALSITVLTKSNCSGTDTSGDQTTTETCDNGTDDDGDGYIDCDDQDCYGVGSCDAGGADVTITTSSIAAGVVNTSYTATLQATGGETPYEWTLDDDGGFTDFFLHTYTGQLSGTLSQCPGTYTIKVNVQDSTSAADSGPKTDSKSYDLEVITNLAVSRTSGSGTDITWSTPTQQETFQANGGHLGAIDWTLSAGGATGFTVSTSGSETCTLKKNGSTTAGSYSFTLTATDSSCATNTAQIILAVTVTSGGGSAPYTVDMVGEWHMDECNWNGTEAEVQDSGDNALHGTAQGGADTIGSGKVCRAASFTATNHGIQIADNALLDFTGNDWSIAFWYRMMENSSGGWDQIFVKGNGSRRNYAMWLRPNSGKIHFRVDPSNQGFDSNSAMTPGIWYFITGVYDSGTLKLYFNGTLDKSASGITMNANSDNDDPLYIGKSAYYNTIKCKVDELRIYSKALSEGEIDELYTMTHTCSGSCYTDPVAVYYMDESSWSTGVADQVQDSSGNSYHGIPYGSAAINTSDSHLGHAGEFSNSDSYIAVSGLPVSTTSGDQTTVTFWMKWLGGNSQMPIGWTTYDLWFTSDRFGFNTGGGDIYGISGAASKLANGWHHVAAVFTNSGTAQNVLFLDGQEQSLSLLQGSQNNRTVGSNFRISGWTNSSGYRFNGLIDELRIYTRGLSASEISEDKDLPH
ncbi:MAG: LamG domain-containing protein, partial [Deltaproteobacteria bacterium]|nr:LamG domain-containing protein [Deltaproteobacteria bacterium]